MRGPTIRVLRTSTLVALAMVACASCATRRTSEVVEEFKVTGSVSAGPTCPVVRNPPDPACADKPVAEAVIEITRPDGEVIGRVLSDRSGLFTISLAAGEYTLTPQPLDGYMGTASAQSITAGPSPIEVAFFYDTGIR